MDAGKMVHIAEQWKKVPDQLKCELKGSEENRLTQDRLHNIFLFFFLFG